MTDEDFFPLGRHFGDLGFEAQFAETGLRVFQHRPHQVGVRAAQNGVQRLDHHDFAAEAGIDAAQFHADVAAAHDQQILRHFLHFQRLGGGHDARIAQVQRLGQRGVGADGHDGLFKIDELLAFGRLDAQRLRVFKIAAPGQDLDAALLGQERYAAGEFFDDGIFPRAQFVQFDLRRAEGDAAMGRFARLDNHLRGVQQGLGRNAAAVEADAAESFVLLHQQHFFAKVGGVKGRGVTAGACAQNHNFSVDRIHGSGGWSDGVVE